MPSCAICRIEAPSEKHLRMHIQAKHDDRVLTCEKCEKKCIGGIKLKTHMQSHKEVTRNYCEKKEFQVVVTLVTLIWLSPVCCRCVTSNH